MKRTRHFPLWFVLVVAVSNTQCTSETETTMTPDASAPGRDSSHIGAMQPPVAGGASASTAVMPMGSGLDAENQARNAPIANTMRDGVGVPVGGAASASSGGARMVATAGGGAAGDNGADRGHEERGGVHSPTGSDSGGRLAGGMIVPGGPLGSMGAGGLPVGPHGGNHQLDVGGLGGGGSPCMQSDGDGDGFGTLPDCMPIDCDDQNPSIHPASFEACNGLDDDCDGQTDEGLGTRRCGLGVCETRQANCQDGEIAACVPLRPQPETCNALDDDCDGQVDENLSLTTCGRGACQRSSRCVDGAEGPCMPGQPDVEVCNLRDDDCDGIVDNGFRSSIVETSYAVLSTFHDGCDGVGRREGSECNAAINRFCAAQDCGSTGFGPVENYEGNAWITCLSGPMTEAVRFEALVRHHEGCRGPGDGTSTQCRAAIHRYCVSAGWQSGFGPAELGAESMSVVCLAESAVIQWTRYSVMSTIHPGCTQQRPSGKDCHAAIKRWCINAGYVSGFGPIEHSGDDLGVVCTGR
ncbi:MAG: putative metal-binding motif-containing protein [Myxococcota bacterium]|nr:putative metal-binding motif-containing protein [Myxococcota bacterium]